MSMKRDINLKTLCRALSLEAAGPDCQIDGLFLAARKTFYRSTLAYAAAYRWITPLFAHEEVKAIVASPADFGNLPVAERSRKSNNAQIMCMGARVIGPELAKYLTDIWLRCEFDGGRSAPKVQRIIDMEQEYLNRK